MNSNDFIKNQQIDDTLNVLYGKIIKYIGRYQNDYCIIVIKAPDKFYKNGYKSVTCMGIIGEIPIGTMCEFTGSFNLAKNGKKVYKFSSYNIIDPDETTEIERYLCNQIDKIDRITAKKICNEFGKNTINILDNDPTKLLLIKGIGKLKVNDIINSWRMHRESMEIHLSLQKIGISLSIIELLKKNAKENNQSIKKYVIDNIYDLLYINENDDFLSRINQNNNDNEEDEDDRKHILTFDEIEKIYSIIAPYEYEKDKKSYKRIEAAIYSFLKEMNFETGNTCQYYNFTIYGVAKIIKDLNAMDISHIVANKYNDENKHLMIDYKFAGNDLTKSVIYTKRDYYNECKIANSLIDLYYSNLSSIKYDKNNIDNKYNDDQKKAILSALENSVSIITGGPGTGKTTIINELVNICEYKNYKKVLLLAPTAKAAKKISEVTGHDAMTIHLSIHCKKEEIYNSDVIIVDEASMMDNNIASKLISMLELHQKIILVGDINQLPSVDIGNVLKDIIESNIFPVTKLTIIYRQKYGNDIIKIANDINNGIVPIFDMIKNDVKFIDIYSYNIKNQYSLLNNILDKMQIDNIQILSPVKKNNYGTYSINQYIQQYLYDKNLEKYNSWCDNIINDEYAEDKDIINIKYKFDIKKGNNIFIVGDRVINNRNNYDKLIFNGEIGIIKKIIYNGTDNEIRKIKKSNLKDISSNKYKVLVHFIGHLEDDLTEFDYNELDSLQLAYATTVHKSQGSEYEYVILFLNSQHSIMLQRNLLYTAVTRAKNKLIIIGDMNAIQTAIYNVNSTKRLTFLKERLLLNNNNLKR